MISINLIKFAFEEDNDINKYCDPNYKNKSIKKIIVSIYKKLFCRSKINIITLS